MPIKAVVYVSEAGPALAGDVREAVEERLQWLIGDASRFNCNAGVTGVLLFDGGRFLQYLEGPDNGVDVAYSRVVGATSHSGLVELQRGRVGQRRLPFWSMRRLSVSPNELSIVAHSDWTGFRRRGDAEAVNATAMDKLTALVTPHVGGLAPSLND